MKELADAARAFLQEIDDDSDRFGTSPEQERLRAALAKLDTPPAEKPMRVGATATLAGGLRSHHVTGEVRVVVRLDKVPAFDECVRFAPGEPRLVRRSDEGDLFYFRTDAHGETCLCRKVLAVYRTQGTVLRSRTAPESVQGLLVQPINAPFEQLVAVPDEIVAWVSTEPEQ